MLLATDCCKLGSDSAHRRHCSKAGPSAQSQHGVLGPADRPSPAPSGTPPRSATSSSRRCPPRRRRVRMEPEVAATVVPADSSGGERREDAAGRKTGNGSAVARDRDRSSPDHRSSAAPRGVRPLSQNSRATLATVCCKRLSSTADSCARVSRARALFLRPTRLRTERLRREGAKVVHGRAQERVAKVEEARPERGAIGNRVHARRGRKPLERANEHRELEVDGGHAMRARANSRPIEHRTPFDELGGTGTSVPRAPLGELGLELEEVPRQGLLQPRDGRLHTVCCMPQRRLPSARGRGLGVSPPPPLEQPAERERRGLARAQLIDRGGRRRARSSRSSR